MKKIIPGIIAMIVAVAAFAFTNKDSEKLVNVIYRYDGTTSQTDIEDETKWVEVASTSGLNCSNGNNFCYMEYTDQAGPNPPTLPSGFNPASLPNFGKKP